MIGRRTLLVSGIAGLASPLLARSGMSIADRYRRSVVIDGNLVPPITTLGPLPSDAVAAIRSSGLTAIKADLDGADTFDSVMEMVRDYQAVIASNQPLLAQVRDATDSTLQRSWQARRHFLFRKGRPT